MSVYVFLGPSLPITEARAILEATYLPPVAMGDVYALVKRQARTGDSVAIIDGLFEQVPAVWHKEILFALSRGVHVYGAASMGALRASELHTFGMIGVGQIFEAFRSGAITDDDEVVVVHGPAERGYRPLSEAMVNVRLGLERARTSGHITPATQATLIALAKSQFYAERTWDSVLAAGIARGLPVDEIAALRSYVHSERPDAKGADARALLGRLAEDSLATRAPPRTSFVLEETTFWIGLTRARASAVAPAGSSASDSLPRAAIVNHLRATSPDRVTLWRHALLLRLIVDLGGALAITRDDVQATTQRFCRRHGIASHAALDEWRVRQHMSKEELAYLLELETRCDVLLRRHAGELDDFVLLELGRRGQLTDIADTVAAIGRTLRDLGISKPTLDDADISADELQRWYEERCGRMTQSPEKHIEELGFESLRDFVSELLAMYMHEARILDQPSRDE